MKIGCILVFKGMEYFFIIKDLLNYYENKLEEGRYFGDDSQSLR
jgi:hypothetical protein